MRVLGKQRNSKMCFICGMDNPAGFKSQFYNMEDYSVITPIKFSEIHQSFPQRVHGGLIATMLDELACRAYWTQGNYELAVTTSMELKYRKPVPYNVELLGHGIVLLDKSRMFKTKAHIIDKTGTVYAEAEVSYLKLPIEKIAKDINMHDEMPYLIEDGISEIDYDFKL
ncbi:PaaI family thioesterase [bacterium]|nr:PaaI family thioesterase [bacterium]